MKKNILFVYILISFFSCVGRNAKYTSPQGNKFFSAKKTTEIMFDIHRVDALLATKTFTLDVTNSVNDSILYECVFDKYGCTRQEFYDTFLYHSQNNIDSLNYYYEKMIDKLTEEQSLLEKK
ncbi:MAG: DUF4296 domain-containing protein [Bacteroidales bacterium]|nr:DUF4296 domain-containing protein [Bacteroidales bacterium]